MHKVHQGKLRSEIKECEPQGMKDSIVTIDLTSGKVTREAYTEIPGGRVLSSKLLYERLDPSVHPLDEDNIMVIAPGSLAGTTAPNCNRMSIGSKSPLTGGIKESNIGGRIPEILAKQGIRALVLEGRAERPSLVRITNDEISVEEAEDLWTTTNYELYPELYKKFGAKIGVLAIGVAGEEKMLSASISGNDLEGNPSRHAGRGGLGAVMGSKNLKAIVVDGNNLKMREPHDPTSFRKESVELSKRILKSSEVFTKYGNLFLVGFIGKLGGLPINNYRPLSRPESINLSGEKVSEVLKLRGGTMGHRCSTGCIVRCSNVVHDRDGNYLTSGFEYESSVMLGTNLGLFELDEVAPMERFCDDFGLDTIEVGAALATITEAGLAEFGDPVSYNKLLEEIKNLTPLGRLLGAGAAVTGKAFGVSRVATAKNQSLAAYDPRALKGTGVTYATSPMGGDHTAGNCLPGSSKVDVFAKDGQVEESLRTQTIVTSIDMVACIYIGKSDENIRSLARMLSSFYNKEFSEKDFLEFGKETLRIEYLFNVAAGISPGSNDLPGFFRKELGLKGHTFDIDREELENIFERKP